MGLCGFLGDLACGIPRGAVIGGKGAGCDWAPCFFHRQMKCDRRARCSRQAAEMGLAAGHNAGISGFVGIGGSGGGGGGVVAALFEAGSRRWARAGLLLRGGVPGGAAALPTLAGALAAGGRARDAWRSSQLKHVLLRFAPTPRSSAPRLFG